MNQLTDDEKQAVAILAKLYDLRPGRYVSREQFEAETELAGADSEKMLDRMKSIGMFDEVAGHLGDAYGSLMISPNAAVLHRELVAERRSRPDRVDAVQSWTRRHWVTAIIIIVILAATVVLTLINQTLSLIDRISDRTPPTTDSS